MASMCSYESMRGRHVYYEWVFVYTWLAKALFLWYWRRFWGTMKTPTVSLWWSMVLGFHDVCSRRLLIFLSGLFWHSTRRKFILLLLFIFPPVPVKCLPLEANILRASAAFLELVYFKVCLTVLAVSSCFPVFKSVFKDEIQGPTAAGQAAQHSKLLTSTELPYQANCGVNLCLILFLLDWI